MSEEMKAMKPDQKVPRRFTVPQRIEHFFLVISFTLLGFTGLVQKYGLNMYSERLISLMGGIEMTRVIHRVAAVVFALLGVYHVIALGYKFYVQRVRMTMIPTLKDAADGVNLWAYNLFLRKHPPKMPRYNFAEKLEYWALIWGGLVMVATGFMLWNPLITTQFLPGQFIPAAKAAHGGEAVLAILAIIVWHFYNVHIKMFNKSMFTGKLTPHQMEEEHEAEWNEIVAGSVNPPPPPAVRRRRQFIFMPAAILFAALCVGGIYWVATAEATAISTLPAPTLKTEIYSPAMALPQASANASVVSAPMIPHLIAGQEDCNACHNPSGFKPLPSNHAGRPIESCRICHRPGFFPESQAAIRNKNGQKIGGPQAVPHATMGAFEDCLLCHGIRKIRPFPDNHANAKVENCTICHR